MAAVVNMNMNNLLNGKDSRWLQLEVCREFQRNKCSRPDTECKFAHPPANVEVQNGRVTACYDSIKVSLLLLAKKKSENAIIITSTRRLHCSPLDKEEATIK